MLRLSLLLALTALGNGGSVLLLDLNVAVEMPVLFPNTLVDG